jgi:Tol biopolymer transport system component
MPDVQEVFRLATQNIDPEQGFVERQHQHQQRRTRNRKFGALALAAVIGLVAVVVVIRAADDGTGAQPAIEPTPTPPARTISGVDYLIDLNTGEMTQLPNGIAGNGNGYAVSPDGTMVAYTSVVGANATTFEGGEPQVFIAGLDFTDVRQVTHNRRGASAPAWSPDGEAIAYMSGDQTSGYEEVRNIFVLDLATGETSQVTNEKPMTGPPGAGFPEFSPDGASIIYEVNRGDGFSVRIVPLSGGRDTPLVGGGKSDVEAWGPSLSPDGSMLAVTCRGRLEGICIADADGTNLRVLVSGPTLFGTEWSPGGTRIAYINSEYDPYKVFVVDVDTGETTFVADGALEGWLDDHTLIVNYL